MSTSRSQAARGLTPRQETLLRRLWGAHGTPFADVVAERGTTREALLDEMSDLFDIGVVEIDDEDLVQMVPPRIALANLLESQTALMEGTIARLNRMGGLVVALGQENERARPPGSPVAAPGTGAKVEMLHGEPPEDLLRGWIAASDGDLRFLRPDQWRLADEGAMTRAFRQALGQGREVQCLYPIRALVDGRVFLDGHRETGEQVRLLPEVPAQMAVVGDDHAMIVTGLGGDERHTMVIREPALVRVLSRWFDSLWDQGVVMPQQDGVRDRREDVRLLLHELARGERDEQIARTLGLGLRTVRRRVADLMIELGAESRFQAGVEAARRGWV